LSYAYQAYNRYYYWSSKYSKTSKLISKVSKEFTPQNAFTNQISLQTIVNDERKHALQDCDSASTLAVVADLQTEIQDDEEDEEDEEEDQKAIEEIGCPVILLEDLGHGHTNKKHVHDKETKKVLLHQGEFETTIQVPVNIYIHQGRKAAHFSDHLAQPTPIKAVSKADFKQYSLFGQGFQIDLKGKSIGMERVKFERQFSFFSSPIA
jgi:glutaredoxin